MLAFLRISNSILVLTVIYMWTSIKTCCAFASKNRGRWSNSMPTIQALQSLSCSYDDNLNAGVCGDRGLGCRQLSALHSSASSSESSTDAPVESNALVAQKAKESLAIAGSSSVQYFGGLPYVETPDDKYRVVFVLGGPGAGKGTQSELILDSYPCVHLSAGELLRQETTKPESPNAELIKECLVSGKIVPVEVSLTLLQNAMQEASGQSLVFLVDGFPRNFDNLEGWTRCMKNVAVVRGALVFQCPLDVLEARIMERAKDSGRSDDNLESLRKRFGTFQGDTEPVIEALRLVQDETPLKVADIRGNQPLEKVWEDTQEWMNEFISSDVLSCNARLLQAVAAQDEKEYQKLCAEEMFTDKSPASVMAEQEGGTSSQEICNTELEFISGTKVVVTYDRGDGDETIREQRIWSYQGAKGWRSVHFSRTANPATMPK